MEKKKGKSETQQDTLNVAHKHAIDFIQRVGFIIISALRIVYRIIPTGTNVNMYEHLKISKTLTGMYTICGPVSHSQYAFHQFLSCL